MALVPMGTHQSFQQKTGVGGARVGGDGPSTSPVPCTSEPLGATASPCASRHIVNNPHASQTPDSSREKPSRREAWPRRSRAKGTSAARTLPQQTRTTARHATTNGPKRSRADMSSADTRSSDATPKPERANARTRETVGGFLGVGIRAAR